MILGRAVIDKNMVVVLSAGTMLAASHIARLKYLHIPSVFITESLKTTSDNLSSERIINRDNAFVKKYDDVVNEAKNIFLGIASGDKKALTHASDMAGDTIAPLVQQGTGLIDHLSDLQRLDSDIYQHSVRVSILAGVIGKWLYLDQKRIGELILAGLLHDIGKTTLPEEIVKMPLDKLTGDDYEIYIQHTLNGQNLLNEIGASDGIKAVALQHHENMDGTGAPFNLVGDNIHEYARIVMVANFYDNITAELEGQIKKTPFDAVSMISKRMFSTLDARVCVPFINNIQNSFLGSPVRLSDGRRGQIIYYPAGYSSLPIVKTMDGEVIDFNNSVSVKIIGYNPKY